MDSARCPPGGAAAGLQPNRLEVADIFRGHLESSRRKYILDPAQQRLARDLIACRTAALGGHLERCLSCGFERPAYNSCRNRHCPKCQGLAGARWVAHRLDRVLPVHYFHVVFTLPSELHDLAADNRALVFELLMKSAAASLLDLGRDPKWFGRPAQLGVTAVLHTWARDLHFHPHVHCIVTGGGLADDGNGWVPAPLDFLFPVHVLGALFRGKVLAGLERLRARGLLRERVDDRAARRRRMRLYKQSWVVYAKRPFGGAEQVYRYLGRYTHRVAISNARLLSMSDEAVVFRTRGENTATLTPIEFIRRFLDHILPRGFTKIRHGGLLAPTNVNGRLARAKDLLRQQSPPAPADQHDDYTGDASEPLTRVADLPWMDLLFALTGIDLKVCPICHSRAVVRLPLPPDCRGPPGQLAVN
jgi:hypothetical protein